MKVAELANPLLENLAKSGRLPDHYVTKETAELAGWRRGRALGNYIPGGQIGGDIFEDKAKQLPGTRGRVWQEADVGLSNKISRRKQPPWRLVYSNDGLAYVTVDHYKNFYRLPNWR
ncbi:ribonuclease domain-containing protein [Saccharomonospora piscinae]|uniref:ribonuclease domain-containing protein n=1 Tax=Saccharomonospora piscinae TaxID=687388 RepID=UPI001AEC8CE6